MATLFGQAIAAFCIGTASGTYNDACNKAVDAGMRQMGVRQQVDNAEDKTNRILMGKADKTLGKESMSVMLASAFVYRTARDKAITFWWHF